MELAKIIAEKIRKNNDIIGFDEFMNLALYHSKYGYYRSNLSKLGASGDFITAPETSDLFGFTLAKQIIDVGGNILEFGAGSGVLAAQILTKLQQHNKLPNTYYILELSHYLKTLQQQNIFAVLPQLKNKVVWLEKLPIHFTGTIIANEVLDAMPTKRIIYQNDKFYELGVGFNGHFHWHKTNKVVDIKLSKKLVNGYVSEDNQQANAWINSICNIVQNGVILLVDYGFSGHEFFHPDRILGTLRCYKNHQASDNPFINIGTQDITSWVNFSNIAQTAKNNGFEVLGYATQAMFLISLGIEQFLVSEKDNNKRIKLANEIKQLVMPNAMGESFKVLALSKDKTIKLTGFKEQNLKASLNIQAL